MKYSYLNEKKDKEQINIYAGYFWRKKVVINELIGILLITVLFISTSLTAAVVYVDADASGTGDGSSWTDAYTTLYDAVDESGSGDELWIAEGRYKPAESDRLLPLSIKQNMSLYGGFTSSMTQLSQRDPEAYPVVLDGNIQDDATDNNNSETLIYFSSDGAKVDGIVFTNGYASVSTNGVFRFAYTGVDYRTTYINNCVFSGNYGRIAYFYDGNEYDGRLINPVFSNCTFSANSGVNGGVIVMKAHSSPQFYDCTFSSNTASSSGGVVYFDNSPRCFPRFERCVFSDNVAASNGGSFYIRNSSPVIVDCSFLNNSASYGGALYSFELDWQTPKMTIADCVFSNNTATSFSGGAFYIRNSNIDMTGCSFVTNRSTTVGGALYMVTVGSSLTVDVADCRFVANHGSNGGAIYASENGVSIELTDCSFINNTSSGSGGAFYGRFPKTVNCSGSLFVGNSSIGWSAGAVYLESTQWGNVAANFEDTYFIGNTAVAYGGAFRANSATTYVTNTIKNCLFSGNSTLSNSGGALAIFSGTTTWLESCTFAGNVGNSSGGALYSSQSYISFSNTIFRSNVGNDNGNIAYFAGSSGNTFDISYSLTDYPFSGVIDGTEFASGSAGNVQVEGLVGNLSGDPDFVSYSGGTVSSAGNFNVASGTTEIVVSTATLVENELVDVPIRIGDRTYLAIANTVDKITVLGNASDTVSGTSYAVKSPRLSSSAGHWTGAGWIADSSHSRCIDAGPKHWSVGAEPEPNGHIINMGFDGGTEYASKSAAAGTLLIIL